MSDNYPVETLLRPAVELNAAVACGVGSMMSLAAPEHLWMTPDVAMASAAITGYLSLTYAYDGLRVKQYQKRLRNLPRFEMNPWEIPVSSHGAYVGKGFHWRARHSQRLRDTQRNGNEHYLEQGLLYNWARDFEVTFESTFLLSSVAKCLSRDSALNPFRPLPPFGGKPEIHGVGVSEERTVLLPSTARPGHTIVHGTTRTGKSRFAELLIAGDIKRGRGGSNVVIVIDPKGDGELMRRCYLEAKRNGRENEFYFFHLGFPEDSCEYNMVGNFQRITEVAGRSTSQVSGDGNSAAFKAFAWRFVNIVASSLKRVGERPSISLISRYVQDMEELLYRFTLKVIPEIEDSLNGHIEAYIAEKCMNVSKDLPAIKKFGKKPQTVVCEELLKEYMPDDIVAANICHAAMHEKSYYDKLVGSLLPFLDKLNTDQVGKLLSPDYRNSAKTKLSWPDVIARGGVVYVGLDAMTDRTIATAVGSAMFDDLVSYLGEVYKHGGDMGHFGATGKMPEIYLHADEFNELIGDEFIPLVNKGGGAGIRITAYTQTIQDIEAKVGSVAKAQQILGNFNTKVFMRVLNEETANLLTKQLQMVLVSDVLQLSGATERGFLADGQAFGSSNEDRISEKEIALIQPNTVMSLPTGHAFMVYNGGMVSKFRIPILSKKDKVKVPTRIQDICAEMKDKYVTSEDWWVDAA